MRPRSALVAAMLALLAAASLPYAAGRWLAPADRFFTGIVADVPDWAQYLAWMRAFTRAVVIENVLTCEPQSPAFFNPQWLLLARAAQTLGLSFDTVVQLFRLGVGALFLWLTWRVCREYFDGRPAPTWAGWILINLSAGLGWIWVLDKYLISGELRYPLDVHVYEPVTFLNLMALPHFLVAAILLLAIFRLAADAVERDRVRSAVAAAALALVLGLTHAYDLVIVYTVLGLFTALLAWRDGLSRRLLVPPALIALVSFPPPAYFTWLTTSDPLWRKVLAQFGNAGVYTPDPLHLLVLLGFPLILTLLTFGNALPRASLPPWRLLVRVWAVSNFFLLYIPADFQIHMLNGWQVPLGLLAAEGVFGRIVPWLRGRGGVLGALVASEARVVALLLLLVLPTNLYLLGWRVLVLSRLEHDYFLYRDEVAAAAWLDAHSSDDEVVLASLTLGQHLPWLSGNKAYLAHWAQTVDYFARRASLPVFFSAASDDAQRRAMLRQCNVRFVVVGRGERALGDLDPAALPYLELAHVAGETRVYRVVSP